MDGIYPVTPEGKSSEQGPSNGWLMSSAFQNLNPLSENRTSSNAQGPRDNELVTSGILLDPEQFLDSVTGFPDIDDLSPRAVDDETARENEKVFAANSDTIPPDLINITKSEFDIPSLPVDSPGGQSFSDPQLQAPDNRLEIGPIATQPLLAQATENSSALIDSSLRNQLGIDAIRPSNGQSKSAGRPLHAQLSAKSVLGVQGFGTSQSQITLPAPKRRKVGRGSGAPGKTKSGKEGASSSGSGGESNKGKAISSKRPGASRARPGAQTANLTAEERRKIRAERNRESAEKSRLRHKQRTLELEQNVLTLRAENRELKARVDTFRIQLQAASQNIETTENGELRGEGIVATQVPALQSAIAAIEQVILECPRTFHPEPNVPEIALNVKARR